MKGTEALVTIIVAIVGVATLAVILSRQSNTVGVVKEGLGGLNSLLRTAVSPIAGGAAGVAGNGFVSPY